VKCAEAHLVAGAVPLLLQDAGSHRSTLLADEHQAPGSRRRPGVEVVLEIGNELGGQGQHPAAGGGLRRADQHLAAPGLLALDPHRHGAVEKVDVLTCESEQLATAEPAERGEQYEGAEPRGTASASA
jgi:hypothetical protein